MRWGSRLWNTPLHPRTQSQSPWLGSGKRSIEIIKSLEFLEEMHISCHLFLRQSLKVRSLYTEKGHSYTCRCSSWLTLMWNFMKCISAQSNKTSSLSFKLLISFELKVGCMCCKKGNEKTLSHVSNSRPVGQMWPSAAFYVTFWQCQRCVIVFKIIV